jgi:2-polyprenyl-3-methyl-5-hydroxy-6-metoxy-1,4-benzoquinol methylase
MPLPYLGLASNEPLDALPQMRGDRRAYLACVLGALGVVPVFIERYGCYLVGKQLTGGSLMEQTNPYDEYAKGIASLEEAGVEGEPLGLLPRMLDLLGNLDGLTILDAGCGEGYLSRVLASRSAKVTGIDVSPRLIQIAREKDPDGAIEYRVGDLSKPLPEYEEHFDAIASRLVLNDIYDYKGFIATLTSVLKPCGRLMVAMNNPYSYVVRKHLSDYFDSGSAYLYRGMAAEGIRVHLCHRTLEEYLDTFLACGS